MSNLYPSPWRTIAHVVADAGCKLTWAHTLEDRTVRVEIQTGGGERHYFDYPFDMPVVERLEALTVALRLLG